MVAALAALSNHHIGLLVYIAFSILKPESLWSWSMSAGNYSRIVGIALLLGWLYRGLGRWQFGRSRGIVLVLVGYWVWSMLCALFAPDQKVAWTFVENSSKIVFPFLVGITVIQSVQELKQVAWVIALGHSFLACEFNRSYYEGWNRLLVMGHGGMLLFYGLCIIRLWSFLSERKPVHDPWFRQAAQMVIVSLVGFSVAIPYGP